MSFFFFLLLPFGAKVGQCIIIFTLIFMFDLMFVFELIIYLIKIFFIAIVIYSDF